MHSKTSHLLTLENRLSFTTAAPRSVKTTVAVADQKYCPETDYILTRHITSCV